MNPEEKGHEEIDLNEEEESVLDAVWSNIEKNGFPDDDFDEDDEEQTEVVHV
jgi:hypothetical protein